MSAYTFIRDSLQNLVAGLGTPRDKSAHSHYAIPVMDDLQLVNAFRGSWAARKGVTIPAVDACRNWRDWQADKDQIEKIEAEEVQLDLMGKIMEARIKARLFGGAAVFIGTGDRDTAAELKPDRIGKGGIKYLTIMTRRQLSATEIEKDPQSPRFGKPKAYRLADSMIEIHPSRLVIFIGVPHPDPELAMGDAFGWGDSVLLDAMPAVRHYDETMGNVVSLVYEAKIDVINIPNLMNSLADKNYQRQLNERLSLAAIAKGINGTLILDSGETHTSKSANFSTLPDIIAKTEQAVSGAFDVPATRMFGQSSSGLGANGEENTRNYYDNVASSQKLDMTPAMALLDELLIRSALGSRPKAIHYIWNPLWQPTAAERSENSKRAAETLKVLVETKLWPSEVLSRAATTMLVEQSVLPGLEAALVEFGGALLDEEGDGDDADLDAPDKAPALAAISDAAPRPLYVQRKVLNGDEILTWAKDQGFTVTVPADDLHVTIAYSKQALDWMKVGSDWGGRHDGTLSISPGGARLIEPLGSEGAVVLLFNSSELAWRHMQIREAGASWDFEDYQPHITITYDAGALDLIKVEPYRGRIELGLEIFEDLDSGN